MIRNIVDVPRSVAHAVSVRRSSQQESPVRRQRSDDVELAVNWHVSAACTRSDEASVRVERPAWLSLLTVASCSSSHGAWFFGPRPAQPCHRIRLRLSTRRSAWQFSRRVATGHGIQPPCLVHRIGCHPPDLGRRSTPVRSRAAGTGPSIQPVRAHRVSSRPLKYRCLLLAAASQQYGRESELARSFSPLTVGSKFMPVEHARHGRFRRVRSDGVDVATASSRLSSPRTEECPIRPRRQALSE